MSTKAVEPVPEIPEVLIDPATGVRLQRGRFLGKVKTNFFFKPFLTLK